MSEQKPLLTTPQRLRYAYGQLLTATDFFAEQEYHRLCLQRNNWMLYEPGVILLSEPELDSLKVERSPDGKSIVVKQGIAIDPYGRQLVLSQDMPQSISIDAGIMRVLAYSSTHDFLAGQEDEKKTAERANRTEETVSIGVYTVNAVPKPITENGYIELAELVLEHGVVKHVKDLRKPIRARNVSTKWVSLTFLPKTFYFSKADLHDVGLEKDLDPFKLHGTYASVPDQGAQGCIEIPIVSGATGVRKVRLAVNSSNDVIQIKMYRSQWVPGPEGEGKGNCTYEPIWQGQQTASSKPFLGEWEVEGASSINEYTALTLVVFTLGQAEIYTVSVEFDGIQGL